MKMSLKTLLSECIHLDLIKLCIWKKSTDAKRYLIGLLININTLYFITSYRIPKKLPVKIIVLIWSGDLFLCVNVVYLLVYL